MSLEKVKPLFQRLLIRKIKETVTSGGIVIPDTVEEDNTFKAEILNVSEKSIFTKADIGTKVIVGKYSGVKISDDLYIVKQEDILGIL